MLTAAAMEPPSAPEVTLGVSTRPLVLIIADISGYTPFMMSHKKAPAHAQVVIGHLIGRLVEHARDPLHVSKLEGDAVFMFASRPEPPTEEYRSLLRERLRDMLVGFSQAVAEAAATSICRCGACANVGALRVKLVVHSGEAILHDIGRFTELSGIDVIAVHRLLKNSVVGNDYVLLTESALRDVAVPLDLALESGVEEYEDIGEIRRHVTTGAAFLGREPEPLAAPQPIAAREVLRHEIRCEYAEVATCPTKGFHFHTGRKLAELVGYTADDLAGVPGSAIDAFAGTGNPWRAGRLGPGQRVVDVGCGAGIDTFIAAGQVGHDGRVIGVDMTPEMLTRAREGAATFSNVEIREGYAEEIPVGDGWADVVISNGVLNLCPDKAQALREMHRVLKPGGRLQIGDILVQKAVPESAKRDIDLWTG